MSDTTCGQCGGTGTVDSATPGIWGYPYQVDCPDCNGTGKQPDPVAYEWTHEERPCRCTPEHRQFCHRCGGTGIYKSARLRGAKPSSSEEQENADSSFHST